jgi:hypothetical protein
MLMLFVELALIRGAASNVVYLSWFTNFVLLASFLGIGLGFLRARRDTNQFAKGPLLLMILVGFLLLFPAWVGPAQGRTPSLVMLGGIHALPPWIELPLIFIGAVLVMSALADEVARLFMQLDHLTAYRWDVLGSVVGIVLFSALSFFGVGPVGWGVVIAVAFGFLLPTPLRRGQILILTLLAAVLLGVSLIPHTTWSPYNRVTWKGPSSTGEVSIRVNGRPFQTMIPVDRLTQERPFYGYPYTHLVDGMQLNNVLVIGAGSGDDVALALSMGSKHVDAVEIDPEVVSLGRTYNPTHPYDDPRVDVHVNDGRAFLEQSDTRYDLILFALPDSLTLVSGQGGLRLESYLFTKESVQAARDHLAPDGVLAMYNYYSPLVFGRYAQTMLEVFGHPPCVDRGEVGGGLRSQSVLTESVAASGIVCTTPWVAPSVAPAPSTDDHPFPYIASNGIPTFYVVSLALVLVGAALALGASGGSVSAVKTYADLFFMGAAFLLLETKNVVTFALLFGTTWFVNSLVFAAVLMSVLGAIEWVQRGLKVPRRLLYGLLFVSLALTWIVRPEALLSLPLVVRFLCAGALAFTPVFFANVIFADRFRETSSSTQAFGANLLGAMVGGILEYAAIVIGYRQLTLVAAGLYLGAMLLMWKRRGSPEVA